MMAFGESIQQKVYELNRNYKLYGNNRKIKTELFEIVGCHSKVKELSHSYKMN